MGLQLGRLLLLIFFSQFIRGQDDPVQGLLNGYSAPLLNAESDDSDLEELVSEQCANESKALLHSFVLLAEVTSKCLIAKSCSKKEMTTISQNFYALKQLDAMGRVPMRGMFEGNTIMDGSYSECREVGAEHNPTNYCYLLLVPFKNASCEGTLPLVGLKRAVCMPRSCSPQDLTLIYNKYFNDPFFTACNATCVERDVPKTFWFWTYSSFLAFMVTLVVVSSLIDYLRFAVYGLTSEEEVPTWLTFLLAFSMYTNAGQLLSVSEPKEGHIRSLDCIRLFSMSWIVACHILGNFSGADQYIMTTADNLKPLLLTPKNILTETFLNGFVSVDTFFTLSGIVVAYLFFKNPPKAEAVANPSMWVLFYTHRIIRLTPPLMFFIGFFVVYGPYLQGVSDSLSFFSMQFQVDLCKRFWWRNLLQISNFNNENICYAPTWYLSADMQLYAIAPVFLIAFFASIYYGIAAVLVACTMSIIWAYYYIYLYDLPPTPIGIDLQLKFMMQVYVKPWVRITTYLIGITTGYLLARLGKRPIRLSMNRVPLVVLGWMLAFAAGLASVYSIYTYDKGHPWSKLARASFYNFHRIAWGMAVSWVVFATHVGWGGPIADFMSHPMWQPFGRLSYSAYIVHWMAINYVQNLLDAPLHFISIWQTYVYYAVPTTLLCYVFAFFWSCLFEVPTIKLEKLLLSKLLDRSSPRTRPREVGNPAPAWADTIKPTESPAWRFSYGEPSPTFIGKI